MGIVPVRTIILHHDTQLPFMKDTILYHDTLRNTMKDVRHPFQRREKEESHRKRKHEYVNEKGRPIAIGTSVSYALDLGLFHL